MEAIANLVFAAMMLKNAIFSKRIAGWASQWAYCRCSPDVPAVGMALVFGSLIPLVAWNILLARRLFEPAKNSEISTYIDKHSKPMTAQWEREYNIRFVKKMCVFIVVQRRLASLTAMNIAAAIAKLTSVAYCISIKDYLPSGKEIPIHPASHLSDNPEHYQPEWELQMR